MKFFLHITTLIIMLKYNCFFFHNAETITITITILLTNYPFTSNPNQIPKSNYYF